VLDDWVSVPGRGIEGIFFFSTTPHPDRICFPPSFLSHGCRGGGGALSSGVELPVHEADHSPSSSIEVKNAWSYTSVIAKGLVKYRDNFAMTFTLHELI
jgi:hypothetical protein